VPVSGKAKRPAVRPSVDCPTYGHESGCRQAPQLHVTGVLLWSKSSDWGGLAPRNPPSRFSCSGRRLPPSLFELRRTSRLIRPTHYLDPAACGVSARFMMANTLSRAARESAARLSSPSSSWFAWLAAASARLSSWSAVKNTTFFPLRLPDIISVSPGCLSGHRIREIAAT
jgi:hypothetical protein